MVRKKNQEANNTSNTTELAIAVHSALHDLTILRKILAGATGTSNQPSALQITLDTSALKENITRVLKLLPPKVSVYGCSWLVEIK